MFSVAYNNLPLLATCIHSTLQLPLPELDTFSVHATMGSLLTSTVSFPWQPGLGPKVKLKCQREAKLQLEDRSVLKMLQVSSWSTGSAL